VDPGAGLLLMWPTPDQVKARREVLAPLSLSVSRLRSLMLRKKRMEAARELFKASATACNVWIKVSVRKSD
jgi:predicted RNA binding protein with dsRBD fold (UPF0201 family)